MGYVPALENALTNGKGSDMHKCRYNGVRRNISFFGKFCVVSFRVISVLVFAFLTFTQRVDFFLFFILIRGVKPRNKIVFNTFIIV